MRIEYFENLYEVRRKLDNLTEIAPTREDYKLLSQAYSCVDQLLSPICSKCGVRSRRFITTPAKLYDPALGELPGGNVSFWTGDWYCPKCRRVVASGEKWWKSKVVREE